LNERSQSRIHCFRSFEDCGDIRIKSDDLGCIIALCEAITLRFAIVNIVLRRYVIRHEFCDLLVSQRIYE